MTKVEELNSSECRLGYINSWNPVYALLKVWDGQFHSLPHSLGIICCHCSGRKLTLWAGLHRCINERMDSWEVLGWYGQIVLFSCIDKFWLGVLNLVEIFLVENTVGLVCQVLLCFVRLGRFLSSTFKVCDSLHGGRCSIMEFKSSSWILVIQLISDVLPFFLFLF